MYLELLPEIQEIVRKYFSRDDIRALSLMNREYCAALRPYVFQRVVKDCESLNLTESIIHNLQYTKRLVLFDLHPEIFSRVDFKSLHTLILNSCNEASEESFSVMCHALPQLKEFSFSPNGEMEDLSCLPNLEALTCLEKFCLSHMDEPVDFVFRHLSVMKSLKCIYLSFCYTVPDEAFKYLAPLNQLEELCLSECVIIKMGKGFECLAELSKLRHLEISHTNCEGDNKGFGVIGSLKSIEELILDDFKITDNAFVHICTLAKLKKLDMSHSRIERETVFGRIKALTALEELILFDCRWFFSTRNLLDILLTLPNLKTLDLRCTGVTEEQIKNVFGDKISSGKLRVISGNDGDCFFYKSISGPS